MTTATAQTGSAVLHLFQIPEGRTMTAREVQAHWESVADRLRVASMVAEERAFYYSELADDQED